MLFIFIGFYRRILYTVFSLSMLTSFLFPNSSLAEKIPISIRLLSSSTHLGNQKALLLGLEINLKEGWHIYAPQEDLSFRPPSFKDQGSSNIQGFQFFWPPSQLHLKDNIETRIYDHTLIIPFSILVDPQKDAHLKATLSLIACHNNLCIPYDKDFSLFIPKGHLRPTPEAPLLEDLKKENNLSLQPPLRSSYLSLGSLMGISLLGGFILNFMPCVLPVLSLKFLSLLKKGISSPPTGLKFLKVRFLMGFLGILTFFIGFAILTCLTRFLGYTIGWGFHFQNPYFLSFFIILLLFFTLNLWGYFEITLPRPILDWMSARAPAASLDIMGSYFKDYAQGLFAALLATPCTAPFLSLALGASLTQPFPVVLLIFLCIGMGFGIPYLLMIIYPNFLYKLPKPGPWVKNFKRFLSLGLLGTAFWLSYVLVAPYENFPSLKRPTSSQWIAFSPENLTKELQKGHSVLVDVTAEWCLTCKLNKFMVYENSAFQRLSRTQNITLMRADWTRKDRSIERYLKSFGRNAIPFTVYYTPSHPEGIILPELLSLSFLTTIIEETL